MLTCGGDTPFPPSALRGAPESWAHADSAGEALRLFLAEPHEPDVFPQAGWVRVLEQPNRVLFVAPSAAATPWVMVAIGVQPASGRAIVDAFGQCTLSVALPNDIAAGTWWVDPASEPPEAADSVIHVLVRERACAGGHSPVDRILEPVVLEGTREITIIIPIRRRPGSNDCAGNPTIPYVIRLPAAVGDRQLLDGATLPARDAAMPPD